MNTVEIETKIYTHLKNNWTRTPIQWPGQKMDLAVVSWLAVNKLQYYWKVTRTADQLGDLLLAFGLFSTDDNLYVISDMVDTLADFYHRKQYNSDNYRLRFKEFDINCMPAEKQAGRATTGDITRTIQYTAITVRVAIEKKR